VRALCRLSQQPPASSPCVRSGQRRPSVGCLRLDAPLVGWTAACGVQQPRCGVRGLSASIHTTTAASESASHGNPDESRATASAPASIPAKPHQNQHPTPVPIQAQAVAGRMWQRHSQRAALALPLMADRPQQSVDTPGCAACSAPCAPGHAWARPIPTAGNEGALVGTLVQRALPRAPTESLPWASTAPFLA
jgi:hypothetical protein